MTSADSTPLLDDSGRAKDLAKCTARFGQIGRNVAAAMGPDGERYGAADLVAVGKAARNPDPHPGAFEEKVAAQGGETHAADLAVGEALFGESRSADEAGAGELDLLAMEGRTTRVNHKSDDAGQSA